MDDIVDQMSWMEEGSRSGNKGAWSIQEMEGKNGNVTRVEIRVIFDFLVFFVNFKKIGEEQY